MNSDLDKTYLNCLIFQLFEEEYPDDPKNLELKEEILKDKKVSMNSSSYLNGDERGMLLVQNWWLDHLISKSTMGTHENIGINYFM